METSFILKDKHPTIQLAMLDAMGIKTHNMSTASISWHQFITINTILTHHCATKEQYVDFWLRFINPGAKKSVSRSEFEERMELLARGRFTEDKTLISINYAKQLYQMFAAVNCLCSDEDENKGDLDLEKVAKRLRTEAINIGYLNQTLKKECEFALDEDMIAEGEIKIRKLMGGSDAAEVN